MACRLVRAVGVILLMLQDAHGEGFMDSVDQMKNQASDAFSKMTGYVDDAQNTVDKAQTTVDGHIQSAKDMKAQASGYYHDAKSTIDGHVDKAKSFSSEAKDTFCGSISISAICGNSSKSSPTPTACTGGSCCQRSSCYSNLIPGLKCDSDRGETTCVGASMLTGSEGMCQCKFGGVCSPQGKCPSMSGVAATRLFEDGKAVPEERFVLPLLVLLGFVGSTLVLGCVAAAQRVRTWARPIPASQRQAFISIECAVE